MTTQTLTAEQQLGRVARGGAIGLVGAAVSAVSGFALVMVVTNQFPAGTAGQFFAATSAFLLLSAVAVLGAETGLARFMLRFEATGRGADVPDVLRAAFGPTLALSVVLGAAVFAVAGPLAPGVGLSGSDGATSLRVLGALLPLMTLGLLSLAGTRAFGRMRTTVYVDKLGRSLAQPLLVLVAVATGTGLVGLVLWWSIPYAVTGVLAAVLFRRFLARRRSGAVPDAAAAPRADYAQVRREFWSFTWPRAITRVSQLAIQRLDIILVAVLRSPTEAALYTAATRFVALGQFGSQAIQQVLQPRFTALLAREEHAVLREVYRISAAWSMAICWPLYLGVACAPYVYLSLFGEEYRGEGVAVVLLMAAAMLFGVAAGPADTLLLMAGRSRLSLGNSLLALAVDVVLCLLLIPRLGITGAAVAWAAANILRCALALGQVRLILGVVSLGLPSAVVAAANVAAVVAPLLLADLLFGMDLLVLAATLPVCAAGYAAALWTGRRQLMLGALRSLLQRGGVPVDRGGDR